MILVQVVQMVSLELTAQRETRDCKDPQEKKVHSIIRTYVCT